MYLTCLRDQKKNYILNYSKDTRKRNEEIVFSIYMLTEQFLIVFDIKKKYKNYTIYVCWLKSICNKKS